MAAVYFQTLGLERFHFPHHNGISHQLMLILATTRIRLADLFRRDDPRPCWTSATRAEFAGVRVLKRQAGGLPREGYQRLGRAGSRATDPTA